MKCYYVYILTNQNHTVLYVGFTNFYNVSKLLYFEKLLTSEEAIQREKQLKKWNRNWKEALINKINPDWKDLAENFAKKLSPVEMLEVLFKNVHN